MSSVKTNMSNKQTNKYKQKQAAAWGQLKLTKQTNKQRAAFGQFKQT